MATLVWVVIWVNFGLRLYDTLSRLSVAGSNLAGADPETTRLLASRAVHRLEYATLLEYTSDPPRDFLAGRYDQLARAEMASGGLRARAEPGRG